MLLRLILSFSLFTQLALSYHCCGMAVMRPDVWTADRELACLAVGACAGLEDGTDGGKSCCDEDTQCPESEDLSCQTVCDGRCGPDQPCNSKCITCAPVEPKKAGPAEFIFSIIANIAHPAIESLPIAAIAAQPPTSSPQLILAKSNHTRQAWLRVWRI